MSRVYHKDTKGKKRQAPPPPSKITGQPIRSFDKTYHKDTIQYRSGLNKGYKDGFKAGVIVMVKYLIIAVIMGFIIAFLLIKK